MIAVTAAAAVVGYVRSVAMIIMLVVEVTFNRLAAGAASSA